MNRRRRRSPERQASKRLDALEQADVLITSVSGPFDGLTREKMTQAMHRRKNQPLFIIDLGVPRNVPHEVNNISNVYLYNIDDLKLITEEYKLADEPKKSPKGMTVIVEKA